MANEQDQGAVLRLFNELEELVGCGVIEALRHPNHNDLKASAVGLKAEKALNSRGLLN